MTEGHKFKLQGRLTAVKTALGEVAAWNEATLDACRFDELHALRYATEELKTAIDALIADRDAALLQTMERIAMIGGNVDVRG